MKQTEVHLASLLPKLKQILLQGGELLGHLATTYPVGICIPDCGQYHFQDALEGDLFAIREALLSEIKNLSSSLMQVSIHRKLVIWKEKVGPVYPMAFTLKFGRQTYQVAVKPDNPYEFIAIRIFWKEVLCRDFRDREVPFWGCDLSIFNRRKHALFTELTNTHHLPEMLIAIEKTEVLLDGQRISAQLESCNLPDEVKALVHGYYQQEQLAWSKDLDEPIQWLTWHAQEYNRRKMLSEKIQHVKSVAAKISLLAANYPILSFRNHLFPGGNMTTLGPSFFNIPCYGCPHALTEESAVYFQEAKQAALKIKAVMQSHLATIQDKLKMLEVQTGNIFGIALNLPSGELIQVCIKPKGAEETRLYNEHLLSHFKEKIYQLDIADWHRQRPLAENIARLDAALSFLDKGNAERFLESELRRIFKAVTSKYPIRRLLMKMEKGVEIDLGRRPWSFKEIACYLVAKDMFQYRSYLRGSQPLPALKKFLD